MPPLISVLLPARDAGAWLADALADLAAQTLTDLEVLVIDDGSTDDTAAIATDFAARDDRFHLLRRPARGIVAALNDGLDAARGTLIARMDADDRCAADRFAKQVALLRERPELGLVGCAVAPPPGQTWAGGYRAYADWVNALTEPEQIARERFIECPIVHPTLVVRRELLAKHGPWRHGDFPEDYDLILRLLDAGVLAAKSPEALYFWSDRDERASRVDPRYHRNAFFRLKARYIATGPLRDRDEFVVWGAGRLARRRVRPLLETGKRVRAWIDIDPRKIGHTHAGAPVLPPEGLAELRDLPLLVYVASRGARELIAEQLPALGFVAGVNAWLCA